MHGTRRFVAVSLMLASASTAACGARSDTRDAADGSVDAGEEATYRVVVLATALQRFAVEKERAGRCTNVIFVSPVEAPPRPELDLDLPESWELEHAWRGACVDDPWARPAEDAVDATAGEGWGRWDDWPCRVSLDLTLRFADGSTERLVADGLTTDGCD